MPLAHIDPAIEAPLGIADAPFQRARNKTGEQLLVDLGLIVAIAVGQIRRASGDPAGAIEVFERIPPGDPQYIEARIQISAVLESQGKLKEALDAEDVRLPAQIVTALEDVSSTRA